MSYTLEQFAAECRAALERSNEVEGRGAVVECVKRACRDETFVSTYLGEDNTSPRQILYEDEALGFCILAHVYASERGSKPHDHGPTWAIYGQAAGKTVMTDWKEVAPGKVEAVRTYELEPGDAHLYEPGAIHSPDRADAARLIRIEGTNMDREERRWFERA